MFRRWISSFSAVWLLCGILPLMAFLDIPASVTSEGASRLVAGLVVLAVLVGVGRLAWKKAVDGPMPSRRLPPVAAGHD